MAADVSASTGPEAYKFTREHEWVRTVGEPEGHARVGISEYAADELGEVVYVALPAIGARIKQMEQFGEIESVKAVADLFAPVTGEVVEINEELVSHPEYCSPPPWGSPFDKGWMVVVRLDDPSELDNLMSFEQYHSYISDLQRHGTEGM